MLKAVSIHIACTCLLVLASATPGVADPGCNAAAAPASDLELPLFKQGPVTVGEEVRLTFTSPAVRGVKAEKGAALVWSQEIRDPGASFITPHFAGFDLPTGAYAVVRAPDGSRSWTYSGHGKEGLAADSGFWGLRIPGETAVVDLYSPSRLAAGAVVIDAYARGFAPGEGGPYTEAICGTDDSEWAQCYQSSEPQIYDKARAVARLFINGTSACTGWLVGDEGHLLTNEHCIGSASAALNTDYELMAEGTCTTNCSSFLACPGTVVATSATLVRSNATLDYSLVQLPTNPTGTYGFLQMRSAGATVDERIYIPGHPGAWGKRIAVTSTHSSDASGFCEVYSLNEPPCSGGAGGDTGYFCDTQGGSSGSPVLAYSDHAVVSLHHCALCPNRGVPIEKVISDLGSDLPNNSLSGGEPPPPPPPCKTKGESCTLDSECCSNKCKGKPGAKTCK